MEMVTCDVCVFADGVVLDSFFFVTFNTTKVTTDTICAN